MADVHTPDARKRNMEAIKHKDTKPEMLIRRGLHARGLRYVLHDKRLPGKPDLVFPRYRAAVFVHGCFWHLHDCHLFKWPSTRKEFWAEKLTRNHERDAETIASLRAMGWRVLTIWECALKGRMRLPLEEALETAGHWIRSEEPVGEIRETDSVEFRDDRKAVSLH